MSICMKCGTCHTCEDVCKMIANWLIDKEQIKILKEALQEHAVCEGDTSRCKVCKRDCSLKDIFKDS